MLIVVCFRWGADTKGVYPAGPPKQDGSTSFEGLENVQLISLEILLDFVGAMAERSEQGDEPWTEVGRCRKPPADPKADITVEDLNRDKSRKALFLQGAAMFNHKPKTGLAFLEKNGIIAPDSQDGTDEEKRVRGIAKFLKSSGRLDKKLLGEYISSPNQIELLKAFIGLFDFGGASRSLSSSDYLADVAEVNSRRDERNAGDFPTTRRSFSHCSNHGDICGTLLFIPAS